MYPDVPDVGSYLHDIRGEVYLQKGLEDAAIAELLQGFKTKLLAGDSADTRAALKMAYQTSGLRGFWEKQLDLATDQYRKQLDVAKQQPKPRYVSPFRLAELHARLGHKDQAFALLDACYENRDENLVWLKAESLRAVSSWESLRSDPRFNDLLRRLGLGA